MPIQISGSESDFYKPSNELMAAINTALFLQRPLLLAGEPGTGKTECADFAARRLRELYPGTFSAAKALRFNTKSVSQSDDLFYTYDAVGHFGDKTGKEREAFISFNCLGVALLSTYERKAEWEKFRNYHTEVVSRNPAFGSVVLIDEIDKAPRDFPNDLLSELEKPPFKFGIKELTGFRITQNEEKPIFIIITSNNEKGLPDAFLRRCVFHHINFPDEAGLLEIVNSNLKMESKYLGTAIKKFMELRLKNITKKPATSELIDWIACLQQKNLLNSKLADWKNADDNYRKGIIETLGIIAKSKTDFETLSKEIGE